MLKAVAGGMAVASAAIAAADIQLGGSGPLALVCTSTVWAFSASMVAGGEQVYSTPKEIYAAIEAHRIKRSPLRLVLSLGSIGMCVAAVVLLFQ